MSRFVLFGPAHLGALGATAALSIALARLVRAGPRRRAADAVRYALAGSIAAVVGVEVGMAIRGGWARPEYLCPLHLCDMAMFLAIYALLSRQRWAAELLYFWAGAGTTLAMLTPDLQAGFPHWVFLVFFGLHGLVVVSALTLTFGFGLAPTAGAPWRALLATLAYAAVVGLVNVAWGTNFMFLRHKPDTATLLDHMGPWPVYILVGAIVALAVFQLLALPFRRAPVGPPS